jgi:hypothetical protein
MLQEKPSAHPALQNLKYLNFFSIFVGHFRPPGSGSTDLIESLDPDPKTEINVKISNVLVVKNIHSSQEFGKLLKGPKREIFDFGVFAKIRPIWIGDLGTRPKN